MAYEKRLGHIPADHYWREDVLEQEIDCIFRPSWLCVGFTDQLANNRDFVTAEVGSEAIVVQNFGGELKAFRNVCSHRFSRIQAEPCGNRPLTCPYHGWSYDAEGVPLGIPMNTKIFGLDAADRAALALDAYAVDTVGHFVFVRMSADGPTLRDYLGDVCGELEHVSQICTERFEYVAFDVAANWKLAMENGVEGYHLPWVHKSSFATVLSTDITMSIYGPHCTHEGVLTDHSRKWWTGAAKAAKLITSDRWSGYVSFMIFPNIVTTFSHGAFFTFQTLTPVSAQTLRIQSSGWLAAGSGGVRGTVIDQLKAFSQQVRDEDRTICEIAQRGVRAASPSRRPILGDMENRIVHFQRACAELMQEAA